MLFMAERAAELAAISSKELPPLCAIAYVLDNAKTVASVIIETFMVILPWVAPLKSRRMAQVTPERLRRPPVGLPTGSTKTDAQCSAAKKSRLTTCHHAQ
jgi:hypothetical protein